MEDEATVFCADDWKGVELVDEEQRKLERTLEKLRECM